MDWLFLIKIISLHQFGAFKSILRSTNYLIEVVFFKSPQEKQPQNLNEQKYKIRIL